MYEGNRVYAIQTEYGKYPSDEVMERVRKDYRRKPERKPEVKKEEEPVKKPSKVENKLITKDHSSYIVGYPDNTFRPNNTITRAEVAAIFARLSKDQSINNIVRFKDVKANAWYSKAVQIGVNQGFINGYTDGTFKPNKPITRAEFAAVISTYANKEASRLAFNSVNSWASDAIDTAYANGWMQGYNGNFRPNDPLTRAEAISTINRMLNRHADAMFISNIIANGVAKAYRDINSSQWYFYDVYAASWGHDYMIQNGVEKWFRLNNKAFTIR